jgi:hypothetical protein
MIFLVYNYKLALFNIYNTKGLHVTCLMIACSKVFHECFYQKIKINENYDLIYNYIYIVLFGYIDLRIICRI